MSFQKINKNKHGRSLALVLSGGFVKGVAHISISEEIYKRGCVPDVFVGISIGTIYK